MNEHAMTARVGVEVGGTFTDLVYVKNGQIIVAKSPSTPSSPDIGARNALAKGAVDLAGLDELAHGSTVATNAILERKGARVALLVTEGFRDLLLLQRHQRQQIYDLHYEKPVPVVRRRDTVEIIERIGPDGSVACELDEGAARASIQKLLASREFDAVAICLLNSFANSAHEARLTEILAELAPDMQAAPSYKIAWEFREFERASTTTLSPSSQSLLQRRFVIPMSI